MVHLTSLLLLVVASCSTFSSAETATTTTGQKVAYNKFKTTGGGGKTDLEKARKFIKASVVYVLRVVVFASPMYVRWKLGIASAVPIEVR